MYNLQIVIYLKGQDDFQVNSCQWRQFQFPSHQNAWLDLNRKVNHVVVDLFSQVVIFIIQQSPTHKAASAMRISMLKCVDFFLLTGLKYSSCS